MSEFGIDPPVPHAIGIGERTPGDPTAEARVVELGLVRAEARLDVAQALAERQLGVRHAEELIAAGETSDPIFAIVTSDTGIELVTRQEFHQLSEHDLSGVHREPCLSTRRWCQHGQKVHPN